MHMHKEATIPNVREGAVQGQAEAALVSPSQAQAAPVRPSQPQAAPATLISLYFPATA